MPKFAISVLLWPVTSDQKQESGIRVLFAKIEHLRSSVPEADVIISAAVPLMRFGYEYFVNSFFRLLANLRARLSSQVDEASRGLLRAKTELWRETHVIFVYYNLHPYSYFSLYFIYLYSVFFFFYSYSFTSDRHLSSSQTRHLKKKDKN